MKQPDRLKNEFLAAPINTAFAQKSLLANFSSLSSVFYADMNSVGAQ